MVRPKAIAMILNQVTWPKKVVALKRKASYRELSTSFAYQSFDIVHGVILLVGAVGTLLNKTELKIGNN